MKHPYRIREIAAQSGLSPATVDRVLHARGGVRASTVREVEQAIADLDRQRSQLRLGGRTFMIDVVVQAPPRFSAAVKAALEAELAALRPAVIRSRFHFLDSAAVGDLVAVLGRIGRTRSHGVILKAPDTPEVVQAVAQLGIPVVTLVTDLPTSARTAYVGIDNRAAGATAAYLVEQWLCPLPSLDHRSAERPHPSLDFQPAERRYYPSLDYQSAEFERAADVPVERAADVLVVRGHGSFRGEDEREMGFRAELRARSAGRRIVEVVDEEDRAEAVHIRIREMLADNPAVRAVYSLYAGAGGNAAVVDAFDKEHRRYDVFIAHDLDGENTALLRERRLSAVLHHDLRQDMRRACQAVMQAQGALPGPVRSNPSAIQVITPHNTPPVEF